MVMCDSNNTAVVGTCTHPIVVYIYLITYVLIVSIVMLNLFTGGAHKQLSGWLAGCFSGWLAGWLLFWLAGWLAGAGRVLLRPASHTSTTSIDAASSYLTLATLLTTHHPFFTPCSCHH
jgi:hypothetical protein